MVYSALNAVRGVNPDQLDRAKVQEIASTVPYSREAEVALQKYAANPPSDVREQIILGAIAANLFPESIGRFGKLPFIGMTSGNLSVRNRVIKGADAFAYSTGTTAEKCSFSGREAMVYADTPRVIDSKFSGLYPLASSRAAEIVGGEFTKSSHGALKDASEVVSVDTKFKGKYAFENSRGGVVVAKEIADLHDPISGVFIVKDLVDVTLDPTRDPEAVHIYAVNYNPARIRGASVTDILPETLEGDLSTPDAVRAMVKRLFLSSHPAGQPLPFYL